MTKEEETEEATVECATEMEGKRERKTFLATLEQGHDPKGTALEKVSQLYQWVN